MKRETCPEDGSHHHLLIIGMHPGDTERSHDILVRRIHLPADLICEDFAQSFKVSAETHAVLLDIPVAHLCDKLVENRILFSEVDYFHMLVLSFVRTISAKLSLFSVISNFLSDFTGERFICKAVEAVAGDDHMVKQIQVA